MICRHLGYLTLPAKCDHEAPPALAPFPIGPALAPMIRGRVDTLSVDNTL